MTMPSPKYVKKTYAIHYDDSSYMIYTLTNEDYKTIRTGMFKSVPLVVVETSVGLLNLTGIRAVIEQKPLPKEAKETKSASPDMDTLSTAWLKEQEDELRKWMEDSADDDIEGGRFS
jgi:hypothetical protein